MLKFVARKASICGTRREARICGSEIGLGACGVTEEFM